MVDIAQLGAVVAAGAFAVACAMGCGAARSAIGHSQFAAQANAICRREQVQVAYVTARDRRRGLGPLAPHVIRQRAAQSQLATERLQALARPGGDEAAAIERWLTARTVAATVALDLAEAPRRGDAVAVADVRTQATRAVAAAGAQAAALGLRTCSEVG